MKNIYFIIVVLFIILYVGNEVRKGKFSIQDSFLWIVASFVALFLAIFPYSIDKISQLLGVEYPPSLFFVMCILFLLLINFKNSKRIAIQQEKIIELGQNLAILKDEIKNK